MELVTTWDELADDLAAALRTVRDRVFLIVLAAHDELAYVQFAGGPDHLDAEASGRHPGAGVGLLADHGWRVAHPREVNWTSPLPVAPTTAELRGLADRCVAALRVAYGVKSPADLTYRAWREPEQAPPGVTWPQKRYDELDPGANPLTFPDLEPDHVVPPAPTAEQAANWKAMTPDEVVRVLDHWATQAWPLAQDAAYDVATDLGWEIEVEDGRRYVVNTAAGLTHRDVSVQSRSGRLDSVHLRVTDTIRDTSRPSVAFLGDAFAGMVAAGTARWGPSAAAAGRRDDPVSRARQWTVGGARIQISLSAKSVTADVTSPEGVEWERQDNDAYYEGY
jgi:hypothetical protein